MTHHQDEELDLFRDMVQRFLKEEVEPNYEQWEHDHVMPKDFWRTMGNAGILLVDMDEQYGAANTSLDVAMMVQEEMCAALKSNVKDGCPAW